MINWVDFISGWLGGIAGLIIGHPADTVKTRQQAKGSPFTEIFVNTYKREGFLGYYKGFTAPFMIVGPSNAVFFFVYAESLKVLQQGSPVGEDVVRVDMNRPDWRWNSGLAGFIGGFAQVIVTCPAEVIKTVLQTSIMKHSNTPYIFKTTREAIKGIYKYKGLSWYYRGCGPMMLRDVPSSSVYTLAYESLLPRDRDVRLIDLILAGGLAGSASWSLIVPFDVVKTRMQTDNMVTPKYTGMLQCAKDLYKTYGWRIFTRGFTVTIIRAFPVNAAIFTGYEVCLAVFRKFGFT